ncbi:bet1-like protein At4g14600 isoform X3 [Rhodamnia argentea]|nr:bet1-like protein At4g14600 isoform X3 [Rhodamnia argentea]
MPRVAARSDEFVLQIDPVDGGLDHEVGGLCRQVHQLRNVAQEIDREAKFQNDMLNQLQLTLIKARAGVKNNVRRLYKSIVQDGSNNVAPVIAFALICSLLLYLRYKISG